MTTTRFTGQTVLITGGSTGIGLSAAARFVSEGAKVVITGRTQASLDQAAAQLGPNVRIIRSDVASASDRAALAAILAKDGVTLDALVANAGIAEYNRFDETTEAEFDKIFNINVKGLYFGVQSLLPQLKDGASVILIASVVSNKGMPDLSLYNASKAAVRSFARSMANDLKSRKIRVNAISPGVTVTPIMQHGLKLSQADIAAFEAVVAQSAPAGRMAHPDEIAAAIAFLASADASYVNGVELAVDGGFAQV